MTAYVIAHVEVLDPEGYREYPKLNSEVVAAHGGRFIARGGKVEALEGDPDPQRLVIIEFPTMEAAHGWYYSPEYQKILHIRQEHSRTRLLAIVEGAQ